MTIDEAIEIKSRTGEEFLNTDPDEIDEAERLSIEALKRIQACRKAINLPYNKLLPGETPIPLREIRVWGKVATLTNATEEFECAASGLPIEKGEDYYCVYICSDGVRDTKCPARVRVDCINDYLNFGGNVAIRK